jgi:hypothetical protein
MSSTISLATINAKIDALLGEVALLRAAANAAPVTTSSPAKTAAVAEKKPRKKRDGPPSAWIIFTNRVRDLLRGNGYTGADLGKQCQMFCGSLKDENKELSSWADADILARRAAWSAPAVTKQAEAGLHWKNGKTVVTPSGSAAASVVSGDADGDADADGGAAVVSAEAPKKARKNPWEGLTPEQRAAKVAAMKAGRDAKKAGGSTDSSSADNTATVVVQAPPSPVLTAAASSSGAVTNAGNAAVDSAADEFKGVMLGGNRYLVNLKTGHCYRREKDGSQGDWAGLFHRTGGPKNGPWIDESVAEPTDGDDDGDDLVFDE